MHAQQLYVWANGDLLQEGLCRMLHVPRLLRPEPLSSQRAYLLSMRAPSTGAGRQGQITVIVNKEDSKMVLAHVVFKTLGIRQQRTVIPERQETRIR